MNHVSPFVLTPLPEHFSRENVNIFSNWILLNISQTLIAGWDELECHRVFNFLCELTNLLQKIEAVVSGKPGVYFSQYVAEYRTGQNRGIIWRTIYQGGDHSFY